MARTNTLLFFGLLFAVPVYILVPTPQSVSAQSESSDGFVLVEAGSFLMGSHNGSKDEIPVRIVTISRSFCMSRYEVTVGEFRRFTEDTGYRTTAEQQGWSWDWYGEYASHQETDPCGATDGSFRVHRGGSWFESEYCLRTAYRVNKLPSDPFNDLGFRLVRTCP